MLPAYFSAADIGFWNKESITIIEAMSTSLPVVLPNQETVKQYITNKNGLFFPDGDVEMLVKQLYALASDADLRKIMGHNAFELAIEKFSYQATAKRYFEIYERILEN